MQQGLADDLVGAGVGGQRLAELRAADGKDLFSEQPRDAVAGTYLVDLLNAVAAITGGGAYIALAQLAGIAGLGWILFRTAFGGSWKDNAKWILLFAAVWGAMIVSKATVRVVDRLDPTLAPAVVANVPIGLALFASLTSQVGDGLTKLTEQAFTLPDDLA